MPERPALVVLEVGASVPGEIAELARIARPTAAALTNVGPAHLAGFGSLVGVAAEKMALLEAVPADGLCLVDGDEPLLRDVAGRVAGRVRRLGFGEDNDLRAVDVAETPAGGVRYRLGDGTVGTLAAAGRHQVKNALFALAFGEAHDVPLAEGARRLADFAGVPGRLALTRHAGVLVADDSYNANPASVRAALDWFARLETAGRKAVALGDMLELGEESARYHEEMGRWVAELAPALAVFVGEESRAACQVGRERRGDPAGCRHVEDSDQAARTLVEWVRPGDAILVKGSRGVGMERVVRALLERPPAEDGAGEGERDAV